MSGIEVIAGSRIHFTLIDMNGSASGRVDGGVGLMLSEPRIRVAGFPATRSSVVWLESAAQVVSEELHSTAESALQEMRRRYPIGERRIEIYESPGLHLGLGTKTQIRLAVATAALHAEPSSVQRVDVRDLGALLRRGGTSGIGTHGFAVGGFLVDGGHTTALKGSLDVYRPSSASIGVSVPPLLAQHPFPDWPLLLAVPNGKHIHGSEEERLFREVCPISMEDIRSLCHVILMQMLPAIVERNLSAFGAAMWAIQRHRWKSFETSSQASGVQRLINRFDKELGLAGVCMSSWGTALLCVDERLLGDHADMLEREIRQLVQAEAGGGWVMRTKALNAGASVSATA